jgi:hypothetical protein
MAGRFDRIDGFLGRLLFRCVGLVCVLIALGTAYAAWSHLADNRPYGWAPVILFGAAAIAAAGCVPYCFSRNRSFVEALDALESEVPDQPRRR